MECRNYSEKAQRDYQLVLAARERGDQRAYADLMSLYREPIYLMLLRMTRNPVEADDLTIETFGKAFCRLDTFSPCYSFATWLFTIASNRGLDFLRRQRGVSVPLGAMAVTTADDAREYMLPSGDDNPEEVLIGKQRIALVRQVVEQLPRRYRQVVQLRYYEELSYDEISRRLQLPMGTVKIQLRRARQLLAQIVQNHKQGL